MIGDMRKLFVTLGFAAAIAAGLSAQARYPAPENIQTIHIALLYRGPAYVAGTTPELQQLQAGHIAHLTK